jgi:hypothetical protein
MVATISFEAVFVPSEDIVAREIEGELIIVPLVAGIGDMEDELFTLNDTGKAVWKRLDGQKNLGDIIADLAQIYEAEPDEIKNDVIGLVEELVKRRMLVEAKI